jgi:hypothetical protein
MWSAVRGSLVAAAVTLALTVPVSAQQRMSGDEGLPLLTSSMRAQAPDLRSNVPTTAIDLEVATSVTALPAAMQRQNQNVALMIVGGAAMIAGSLIDGDTGTIVMAGGGILVLVGLFRYLN